MTDGNIRPYRTHIAIIVAFLGLNDARAQARKVDTRLPETFCASQQGNPQRLRRERGATQGSVLVTLANRTQSYPVAGPKSFFATARRSCANDKYVVHGGVLSLQYGFARYKSWEIYDIQSTYAKVLNSESSECEIDWRTHFAPLSLVGSVFSYETMSSGYTACGSASVYHMIKAIDLVTGDSVSLTDLLDESAVVDALKKDSFLREQRKGQSEAEFAKYLSALDLAHTSEDLSRALSMSLSDRLDSILRNFAVLSYDSAENLVAVRLAVPDHEILGVMNFTQLGIVAPPAARRKQLFRDAANGAGFFLGKYPNTVTQKRSTGKR